MAATIPPGTQFLAPANNTKHKAVMLIWGFGGPGDDDPRDLRTPGRLRGRRQVGGQPPVKRPRGAQCKHPKRNAKSSLSTSSSFFALLLRSFFPFPVLRINWRRGFTMRVLLRVISHGERSSYGSCLTREVLLRAMSYASSAPFGVAVERAAMWKSPTST